MTVKNVRQRVNPAGQRIESKSWMDDMFDCISFCLFGLSAANGRLMNELNKVYFR
jgi:hypothetical protein